MHRGIWPGNAGGVRGRCEPRVQYTFFGLYDEDLIVVVQTTRSAGGNYATAAVGFARGQDFEVVE